MNPFFINKPSKTSEIIGQDKAIKSISLFLNNFRKGLGLFLYGSIGTGKTSSVYAFAKEYKYEVLELNASDSRNAKQIKEFLGNATGQRSLFSTKKIILIDEVDGLSGMKDRGAAKVISDFIKKSTFPIIVTGSNAFDKKVSPIVKVCKKVEFNLLSSTNIYKILNNVVRNENLNIDDVVVKNISRECGGDARAALNDLFCVAIDKNNINNEDIGVRKRTDTMVNALIRVLKSKDSNIYLGAYDNVDEDLDKIFLWLDQNLPDEYLDVEDLSKSYDNLALADRFFGRIKRWQYYRFYVYCYQILSAGIALSKKTKYKVPPKYKRSTRLLKYWQANITYAKRKSIIEKISNKTNISSKRALKESYPYLILALIKNKELAEEFELSYEEIDWLKKYQKNK